MLTHEVFKTAEFWNVTHSSMMEEPSHILRQQSGGTEYKTLISSFKNNSFTWHPSLHS
jgi:hypothetical protein